MYPFGRKKEIQYAMYIVPNQLHKHQSCSEATAKTSTTPFHPLTKTLWAILLCPHHATKNTLLSLRTTRKRDKLKGLGPWSLRQGPSKLLRRDKNGLLRLSESKSPCKCFKIIRDEDHLGRWSSRNCQTHFQETEFDRVSANKHLARCHPHDSLQRRRNVCFWWLKDQQRRRLRATSSLNDDLPHI